MDLGYLAPTDQDFSVDDINELTEKTLGWPVFGYWYFFNDEDAGPLMDRNVSGSIALNQTVTPLRYRGLTDGLCKHESTYSLIFPSDYNWMRENFCYPGAARLYIEQQKTGPLASWISREDRAVYDKIFATENGGHGPPLNWYKCPMANLNTPDERMIPEEKRHVKHPTLMITAKYDVVCVPEVQVKGMEPFVKDWKVVEIEAGHWNQLEKPMETNKALEDFLEGK